MKKPTIIVLVSVLVALLIGVGLIWSGTRKSSNTNNKAMTYSFPGILAAEKIDNKKAVLQTSKGTIEFTLKSQAAPKTVSNFVYLTENGFYDGLTFHRVVPEFVIQGGDPLDTGQGGPGYDFEDEPVKGDYIEGSVAMANSGPDTNGSQFFITLTDQTDKLPKQYSLFGQVTKGMEVVKNIVVGDRIEKITIVNQ
jgi:cyclophilin family peptidyl-prolyl cis-trans isomerase